MGMVTFTNGARCALVLSPRVVNKFALELHIYILITLLEGSMMVETKNNFRNGSSVHSSRLWWSCLGDCLSPNLENRVSMITIDLPVVQRPS